MRITHTTDDRGLVQLVLEFPLDADPDRTADVAWAAVSRVLTEHQGFQRGAVSTAQ